MDCEQNITQLLPISFSIDESFQSERFIKCRARVCHDGISPKNYILDLDTMERAKNSIYNIPILAHVIEDEEGNLKFGSHDMTIVEDQMHEGEYRCFYEEQPIGVVPETCNYQIEEYKNRNYACVDFYIWKDYSNYAQDIIEELKTVNLSMEINIKSYQYNQKDNAITILDYEYLAITLLGNDVKTGMADAQATMTSFSLSEETQNKMLTMMQELKNLLAFCNTENDKEGGKETMENTEKFENSEETIVNTETNGVSEQIPTDTSAEVNTLEAEGTEASQEKFENSIENNGEAEIVEKFDTYTVKFQLSFECVRNKVAKKLRKCEEREDEDSWVWITALYNDCVIYTVNGEDDKFYKRDYTETNGEITLAETAIEVFPEFLTAEEQTTLSVVKQELENARQELATLKEYKDKYDLISAEKFKADKEEVFTRFEPLLKSNEEFEALKADETLTNIQDIENACFTILGKKSANFALSSPVNGAEDKTNVKFNLTGEKNLPEDDEYGGLFAMYANK